MHSKIMHIIAIFFSLLSTSVNVVFADSTQLLDPLAFVPPLPTIPSSISVGMPVQITYTIKNNVPNTYLPITTEILNSEGVPIDNIITRVNIGVGNDCGPEGNLLRPLAECSITLSIDPVTSGAQSYTLSIDYDGRDNLISPISFNGNASPGFAYISNSSADSVTFCQESAGGLLGSCGDPGVTGVTDPAGIAIQTISGTPYEYIVNQSGSVSKCTLDDTTGEVVGGTCASVVGSLSTPIGIAFQTISSTLFSYITDSTAPGVTECTVNSDGTFTGCSTNLFPSAFDTPFGIGIARSINGTDYAYVTNLGTSSVSKCAINATTGVFSNCFDSGAGDAFDVPQDIAFTSSTNPPYAYITDSDFNTTGTIWQCAVNSTTGNLSACASSSYLQFDNPLGITLAPVGSSTYTYATNTSGDSITQCTVGAGGVLESCSNTSSHNTISPGGLAFSTFGGDDYTYLVNLTGSVSQCRISSPSGLLYCIDSGVGSAFTDPLTIAFQTVNSGANTYAYVTDPGVHEVTQCAVNQTTGVLSSCGNAGPLGLEAPFDITFGTVTGTLYAYISVPVFEAIFQCEVDVDGTITGQIGALCNCTDAGKNMSEPYIAPTGVSFQTFSGTHYVYVVDETNNAAYRCAMDSAGLFTSCINENVSSLTSPKAIVFQTVNSNNYAYITNTQNFMMICPVDNTGTFGTCSQVSVGAPSLSISFDIADNKAYVSTNTSNTLLECDVSTVNGSLSNCTSAFGEPIGVAILTISGSTKVAYILQTVGSGLELCQMNQTTGQITSCADSGSGFYFSPPFVPTAIGFSGSFVYVANSEGTGTVAVCAFNSTNGAISACTDSGAGFNFGDPTGIAFDTVSGTLYIYLVDEADSEVIRCTANTSTGALSACAALSVSTFEQPEGIAFNANQAYITDVGLNQVIVCEQQTGGALALCADSGVGAIFSEPNAIAMSLANVSGVPNAYITNGSLDSVTRCVLNATTGLFDSCGNSSASSITDPTGIAFGEFNGLTYGYITNGSLNSVTQCSFNTSTGLFSACADSGATTLAGPAGIVFFNP